MRLLRSFQCGRAKGPLQQRLEIPVLGPQKRGFLCSPVSACVTSRIPPSAASPCALWQELLLGSARCRAVRPAGLLGAPWAALLRRGRELVVPCDHPPRARWPASRGVLRGLWQPRGCSEVSAEVPQVSKFRLGDSHRMVEVSRQRPPGDVQAACPSGAVESRLPRSALRRGAKVSEDGDPLPSPGSLFQCLIHPRGERALSGVPTALSARVSALLRWHWVAAWPSGVSATPPSLTSSATLPHRSSSFLLPLSVTLG